MSSFVNLTCSPSKLSPCVFVSCFAIYADIKLFISPLVLENTILYNREFAGNSFTPDKSGVDTNSINSFLLRKLDAFTNALFISPRKSNSGCAVWKDTILAPFCINPDIILSDTFPDKIILSNNLGSSLHIHANKASLYR